MTFIRLFIHPLIPFCFLQSVVAKGLLTDISDKANYVPIMMNFSAQTSSQRTQEMIEVKLEKKRKNILGNGLVSSHSHVSDINSKEIIKNEKLR